MAISDNQNQLVISAPAFLSDGNGGFGPCPELLTESEAIRYLRLDRQKADSAKTLSYYREQKKLRPTKIGKNLLYSRRELDRFVETMTG
jgi:hypothetical protein